MTVLLGKREPPPFFSHPTPSFPEPHLLTYYPSRFLELPHGQVNMHMTYYLNERARDMSLHGGFRCCMPRVLIHVVHVKRQVSNPAGPAAFASRRGKQTVAMNQAAEAADSEAAPPTTGEDNPGDQAPDATKEGGSARTLQEGTATGGEPSPSRAVAEANSATNAAGEEEAISASAGEDSSTSSSPPEDNPIRGTSSQRQIVRRMVRGLYEGPWHADDLLWNLSQNRLTSMASARVGDKLRALGGQTRRHRRCSNQQCV